MRDIELAFLLMDQDRENQNTDVGLDWMEKVGYNPFSMLCGLSLLNSRSALYVRAAECGWGGWGGGLTTANHGHGF